MLRQSRSLFSTYASRVAQTRLPAVPALLRFRALLWPSRPILSLPPACLGRCITTNTVLNGIKSIWEEDWKPSKKKNAPVAEDDEEELGGHGQEGEEWAHEEEDEEEEVDPEEDEDYDESAPVRPRREVVAAPYDVSFVVSALRAAKAADIVVIDLSEKVDWVHYMIHATGRSRAHIRALANTLLEELKKRRPGRAWKLDQKDCDFWVILNSQDILVNLWTEEERQEYDLERTWVLRRNERNPFAAEFDELAETEWIYDDDDEPFEEFDPDVEKIKGF